MDTFLGKRGKREARGLLMAAEIVELLSRLGYTKEEIWPAVKEWNAARKGKPYDGTSQVGMLEGIEALILEARKTGGGPNTTKAA